MFRDTYTGRLSLAPLYTVYLASRAVSARKPRNPRYARHMGPSHRHTTRDGGAIDVHCIYPTRPLPPVSPPPQNFTSQKREKMRYFLNEAAAKANRIPRPPSSEKRLIAHSRSAWAQGVEDLER